MLTEGQVNVVPEASSNAFISHPRMKNLLILGICDAKGSSLHMLSTIKLTRIWAKGLTE